MLEHLPEYSPINTSYWKLHKIGRGKREVVKRELKQFSEIKESYIGSTENFILAEGKQSKPI